MPRINPEPPADPTMIPGDCWASMHDAAVARRARLRPMWEMSPRQRRAAMARGELTIEQLTAWSAREPHQLPRINGEYTHIYASTPEACITCPCCGGEVINCGPAGRLQRHPDERHPAFGTPNGFRDGLVPACPASSHPLAEAAALSTPAPTGVR